MAFMERHATTIPKMFIATKITTASAASPATAAPGNEADTVFILLGPQMEIVQRTVPINGSRPRDYRRCQI
jgi:hypothetical protein